MMVQCVICGDKIQLSEDSEAARDLGIDPSQQLRKHLLRHALYMMKVGQMCGWLIDRLLFDCPTHPEIWDKNTAAVIEWTKGELRKGPEK